MFLISYSRDAMALRSVGMKILLKVSGRSLIKSNERGVHVPIECLLCK